MGGETMKAKVRITWREELVEDDRNFYIKLSPDVQYELVGIEDAKKGAVDKLLKDLQEAAKNAKVKR